MTQEERAKDMASRLFDAIALRVDQFFKAKNIQGGVKRGDDLFSPMDKHELAQSLLQFADEIRAESVEKAWEYIELKAKHPKFGMELSKHDLCLAVIGKELTK
jgi:hypothetical protein